MEMWQLVFLVVFLVLVLLVFGVVIPKNTSSRKVLVVALQGLIDEYFLAHTDRDLERRHLRFHKLTISTDRVLGKILAYYGCIDNSVKQQMRVALQKSVITYDQFQTLKRFHHMRNEVVHEGLIISGDNENAVYGALLVMKAALGI